MVALEIGEQPGVTYPPFLNRGLSVSQFLLSSRLVRRSALILLPAVLVVLSGCSAARIGSRDARSYGPIVRGGLKPVGAVPENCQAFARGQLSVSQCHQDPSCRPCIVLAVKDIPPARAR
jgi:hypothetical protein